jgi:ferritin-like metal-binding protein YciE
MVMPIVERQSGRMDMGSKARDIFIVGLRNAHAMETQAQELMERQSERLTDYPEVRARVQAHLRETEGQLNRIEQCLSSFGDSPSTIKDTTQSLMGNLMAVGHSMAGDEILKNTFANDAFEHYEIAAYKSLLTLCEPAGADNARGGGGGVLPAAIGVMDQGCRVAAFGRRGLYPTR